MKNFKNATLCLVLILAAVYNLQAQEDQKILITIDPESDGPQISRHIFGQFAEHLGRGIYEGVWVGPASAIPNTRGIRNDVVEALRELNVPNVRWPGGCFADEYHWRDGIGTQDERMARINASWAGRPEPNTFGTHEYFDFLKQIGANAFISANVGSGTVKEAADWLEYLTAEGSSLALERSRNGHPDPYPVAFWGIGNESWGCGGPLTAEEYLTELKKFSNFSTNYNPALNTRHIAVGPDGADFAEYTEVIMNAWSTKSWAWNIGGISLHRYTRNGWPPNIPASGFDNQQYANVLAETVGMDSFISENEKIMNRYDPEGNVAIFVDEWGTWYAPTEGTDPGSLEQENTIRDAIVAALNFNIFVRHAERVRGANIAQMINVLQSLIITKEEEMILTPTYHAFRLYVPFQQARRLSLAYNSGIYAEGNVELQRLDAIAAKQENGHIILALTNLDPVRSVTVEVMMKDRMLKQATGETLSAPFMDSQNTFENPEQVKPQVLNPRMQNGKAEITLKPHSVTVILLN